MRSWAEAAGLEVETERSLRPTASPDERLTVRLWLLRALRAGSTQRTGGGVMASVSFELFPPRTRRARRSSGRRSNGSRRSAELRSVTCGAGGSGGRRDARRVRAIRRGTRCGSRVTSRAPDVAREEVDGGSALLDAGVRHIVALRGDMPEGRNLRAASRRIRRLARADRRVPALAPFEVSVAAYPEPHPESRSLR